MKKRCALYQRETSFSDFPIQYAEFTLSEVSFTFKAAHIAMGNAIIYVFITNIIISISARSNIGIITVLVLYFIFVIFDTANSWVEYVYDVIVPLPGNGI